MKVGVILPYENASLYYKIWAHEEEQIDFDSDASRAARCTLSYAAEELCSYLCKMGISAEVSDSGGDFTVYLSELGGEGEDFSFKAKDRALELVGSSRKALLYAVYELLEAQGVRWYAPDVEYVPKISSLKIPEATHYSYSIKGGRGYHFEGLLKESCKIITWMARNRMNLAAPYAYSVPLLKKLCFTLKTGGHIFEKILAPTNLDENGKRYIDAHREWYGKRDGEINEKNAQRVQFCVSCEDLLSLISDTVVKKVQKEWRDADVLELAGFDTWGASCACEKCKRLGTGADITLHFLSRIRERLNEAHATGVIKKNPRICFDIYEGTNTLEPPVNAVPKNLIEAGDYGVWCPILRCYEHGISDPCDKNAHYKSSLEGWKRTGLGLAVNEYYNVSKFEDLPLLFTDSMKKDIPYYVSMGVFEIEYMHFSVDELGVRRLNDYILYSLARDPACDTEKLKAEYFSNIYGEFAARVSKIYSDIEKATSPCSSFRAWNHASILTPLMEWDGCVPEAKLPEDSHLKDKAASIAYGISDALSSALLEFKDIRRSVCKAPSADGPKSAVNPAELNKLLSASGTIGILSEDIRGLRYGKDVFLLTALMLDYRDSLMEKRADSPVLLKKIEELGEMMSEYTYGISVSAYTPEIETKDALRRSQLSALYYSILKNAKLQ